MAFFILQNAHFDVNILYPRILLILMKSIKKANSECHKAIQILINVNNFKSQNYYVNIYSPRLK